MRWLGPMMEITVISRLVFKFPLEPLSPVARVKIYGIDGLQQSDKDTNC